MPTLEGIFCFALKRRHFGTKQSSVRAMIIMTVTAPMLIRMIVVLAM